MEIHDKKQLAAICIERLKKEGFAHVDDGALVIDVQEERILIERLLPIEKAKKALEIINKK